MFPQVINETMVDVNPDGDNLSFSLQVSSVYRSSCYRGIFETMEKNLKKAEITNVKIVEDDSEDNVPHPVDNIEFISMDDLLSGKAAKKGPDNSRPKFIVSLPRTYETMANLTQALSFALVPDEDAARKNAQKRTSKGSKKPAPRR